jgi:SSS family solute:Na+ symporter
MTSIYLTLFVYFGFLLFTGWRFRSLNQNLGDFVRGGGMGTWWVVGVSLFISNVSAMTFTGMGSIAFEAGAAPLIAYAATASASLIAFLGLAAWCRQSDAYTVPDILRARFGPKVEQLNSYSSLIWGIQNGAIWLWGLSIFCSTMFGLSTNAMIVSIGATVAIYSITGGRWAVMGTDFIQSLIILPVSLIVFALSLKAVGGVTAFADHWNELAVQGDFALIKTEGKYTTAYVGALVLNTLVFHLSFFSGGKFLSASDGGQARKAALFGAIAVVFGAIIWMVPAITSRFLYEAEVLAHTEIANAADTAYAVAARNVLPANLSGLMIIVLFAATMSNMDTGLNTNAGIFVRNILGPLRRLLGYSESIRPEKKLRLGQMVTGVNGLLMIALALIYANASSMGILELAYTGNVLLAFPLAIPVLMGTWIKRFPPWAYFFSFGCAIVPAGLSVIAGLQGNPWSLPEKTFSVLSTGIIAMLITIPFYKRSSIGFRQQVDAFFLKTRTPIDNSGTRGVELKRTADLQRKILGSTILWAGTMILFLLLIPSDGLGHICVGFVSVTLWAVGLPLRFSRTK